MTGKLVRLRGWLWSGGVVILLLPLAGCARNLIFSTYTTIGFELKGESEIPTSVRLAYKRFAGAVVPVDPQLDDPAHSVVAIIDAEQSWWRVRVNQVFATGAAADQAAHTEKNAAAAQMPGPIASAVAALKEGTP